MRFNTHNAVLRLTMVSLYVIFFFASPAFAHKPSDSYLTIYREGENILGEWHVSLRDLDYAIGLDTNNNGEITWKEVKEHHKNIADYVLPKLKMKVKDKVYKNVLLDQLIDNHTDGTYTVLRFKIDTPPENKRPLVFDLQYNLFFEIDPLHRGLLSIRHKGKIITAIFSPEKSIQHFNLNSSSTFNQLLSFMKEGVWHIWIGFDHILFLLSLLLPAVLIRRENEWQPVNTFGKAFKNVFKVVTAFTLAHSVTLSLVVLGFVQLPSRLVESLIALSVVCAALNNLFPVIKDGRWIVAYCFGLIHGFGFASVLMDLNLPQNSLLSSLLGFNLGVEVGQLVIVCAFLPFAFTVRFSNFYRKIVLNLGSLLIVLIASFWFIERVFDLRILPGVK